MKRELEELDRNHAECTARAKKLFAADIFLLLVIVVAIVICVFGAWLDLKDGLGLLAVIQVLLVLLNGYNGFLTIKRMVKVRKIMRIENEAYESLRQNMLRICELEEMISELEGECESEVELE